MDRTGVFVDAGYLFAQGSEALTGGTKLRRSETLLDQEKVIGLLEALAGKITGLPLLRIYWYDGTDSGPTAVHLGLASRPNLKIRLGLVNTYGQQKGVDSLIVSDLINLSRNGAMADAVLLTGDEDIRVGVQQAQEVGVRVHLVGIEGIRNSQSYLLKQEADTVHELTKAEVQTFLTLVPSPPLATSPALVPQPFVQATAAAGGVDVMLDAAEQFAASLGLADVERVAKEASGKVPPDIDRQLLHSTSATIGASLTEPQKRRLRNEFVRACKARA